MQTRVLRIAQVELIPAGHEPPAGAKKRQELRREPLEKGGGTDQVLRDHPAPRASLCPDLLQAADGTAVGGANPAAQELLEVELAIAHEREPAPGMRPTT